MRVGGCEKMEVGKWGSWEVEKGEQMKWGSGEVGRLRKDGGWGKNQTGKR